MKTMLFAFTVLLSLALPAGTWYVDASRPDDAGDGLGPETAKRTLQAAVNAAEASGETELTVLVAPGKPVAVKATVVGEGALQVKVNGALVGTLVAGVPRVILEGLSAEDRIEIAFSGAGEALLAGLKGAGGFHVIVR